MKIFVEKSLFANELKLFQGIFEKKSLMDILQNIKVTATDNGLIELIATDLEIGLLSTISLDVKEAGVFTVNGRDFYDLISKMPEGIVEISENNDLQIIIINEQKTCKYKLLGLQSSDYPQLPISDFSTSIKISMKKLSSMINKNYYIISPEIKFNIGGALMSISDKNFEMAATDGHRLSYTKYINDEHISEMVEFIVSRKTLLELLKFGDEGDIEFNYDKNNLFFKYKNKILSSRIIDQKFPNYKTVIPEKSKFKAIINTENFLNTLRRVLIFKMRNNEVVFNFSHNKLILERITPEKGEAHDELDIDYKGDSIKVSFNGNFILDFLTHVESNEIQVCMSDKESSFVFKPLNNQNIDFIYVVMPLNI